MLKWEICQLNHHKFNAYHSVDATITMFRKEPEVWSVFSAGVESRTRRFWISDSYKHLLIFLVIPVKTRKLFFSGNFRHLCRAKIVIYDKTQNLSWLLCVRWNDLNLAQFCDVYNLQDQIKCVFRYSGVAQLYQNRWTKINLRKCSWVRI